MEYDKAVLDRYVEGFNRRVIGGECVSLLNRHFVAADTHAVWIEYRPAGSDIEFPAVPRALDDILIVEVGHFERSGRVGPAKHNPEAERGALVGTTAAQGEEFTANVEDTNRASGNLNDAA